MRAQQRIKHADLTSLYAVVHSAHQVAGLSVLHAILGSGAFNGGYLGSADGEAIILAIIECKVYLYAGLRSLRFGLAFKLRDRYVNYLIHIDRSILIRRYKPNLTFFLSRNVFDIQLEKAVYPICRNRNYMLRILTHLGIRPEVSALFIFCRWIAGPISVFLCDRVIYFARLIHLYLYLAGRGSGARVLAGNGYRCEFPARRAIGTLFLHGNNGLLYFRGWCNLGFILHLRRIGFRRLCFAFRRHHHRQQGKHHNKREYQCQYSFFH